MKSVNAKLDRDVVLQKIERCLRMVEQWASMRDWQRAGEYCSQATALIELLEVDDCGSTGGFDRERGQCPADVPLSLQQRYEWLKSLPQYRE